MHRLTMLIIMKTSPASFMPLVIFHLICILLLMMKMNKKQFLFHSRKIRAEGQIPLSWTLLLSPLLFQIISWILINYKRTIRYFWYTKIPKWTLKCLDCFLKYSFSRCTLFLESGICSDHQSNYVLK